MVETLRRLRLHLGPFILELPLVLGSPRLITESLFRKAVSSWQRQGPRAAATPGSPTTRHGDRETRHRIALSLARNFARITGSKTPYENLICKVRPSFSFVLRTFRDLDRGKRS